jgi:hypothetical protein
MDTDLHTEILMTLRRVEAFAFARAKLENRFERQQYFKRISEEFTQLFDGLGLKEGSFQRERFRNMWAAVVTGNPDFILGLYPQFCLEILGQINWEIFHEATEVKPVAITGRKVQHLTVVEN